jgi:hypothetical protein
MNDDADFDRAVKAYKQSLKGRRIIILNKTTKRLIKSCTEYWDYPSYDYLLVDSINALFDKKHVEGLKNGYTLSAVLRL